MLIRSDRTTTALLAALFAIASLFLPAVALQPGGPSLTAETPAADQDPVVVSLEAQRSSVRPGDTLVIAVILNHQKGWHTHTNDPKVPLSWKRSGLLITPTEITHSEAAGFGFGPIQWPASHEVRVDFAGTGRAVAYSVFEGRAVAFVPIQVAADAAPGERELTFTVTFQACDDRSCIQAAEVEQKLAIRVDPGAVTQPDSATFHDFDSSIFADMAAGTVSAPSKPGAATSDADTIVPFDFFGLHFEVNTTGPVGIFLILVVGMVGGLILNLTPCVLPVIPIKIIGLQNSAAQHGGGRSRTALLGGSMFLGVVAFWFVLGVLIAGIRAVTFVSEIFGNFYFQIGVAAFIGIMAAGMLGAFTIQVPQRLSAISPRHDTLHGSFLFGIMTAILGVPCFGPFAGAVTGWATLQPVLIALAAFSAIGLGMGLPYFILAMNPKWVSFIPRTGPASELVKQIMGLLLLATAAFFLWNGIVAFLAEKPNLQNSVVRVFGDKPYLLTVLQWWVIALLCLATAGWLAYRTFRITGSPVKRAIFSVLAVGLAVLPILWTVSQTAGAKLHHEASSHWKPYTPEAEAEALAAGKVVVTDFTAMWCINCKVLETTVLSKKRTFAALSEPDVVCLTADLTSRKAPGWAALKKLNERGIPVISFQGPGAATPHKLYFGATIDDVVAAIDTARGGTRTASTEPSR